MNLSWASTFESMLPICSTVCVVVSGFPTPRYRHNWTSQRCRGFITVKLAEVKIPSVSSLELPGCLTTEVKLVSAALELVWRQSTVQYSTDDILSWVITDLKAASNHVSCYEYLWLTLIKRPCVAGAVLQTFSLAYQLTVVYIPII